MPEQSAPLDPRADRRDFHQLLDELADEPEREAELIQEIDRDFGVECAVAVFDMSGFSRTTQTLGIIPFLGMIRMVQRLAVPAIEDGGGRVLKAEADNLWCVFPDVADAVEAARGIRNRLDAANVVLSAERELHLSAGIGFGRVLVIDDAAGNGGDLFGDEVNLAGKLGEDLAGRDEVLLSVRAAARVSEEGMTERRFRVSGLELSCFALPDRVVAA